MKDIAPNAVDIETCRTALNCYRSFFDSDDPEDEDKRLDIGAAYSMLNKLQEY